MTSPPPPADSRLHFLDVIEQIKDYAIFSLDLQGRATSWNQGVRHVLGFEPEAFLGQDITGRLFTPEAVHDGVPERELELAAAAGQVNNDRWMCRQDGETFYAAGITSAVRDDAGGLIGFVKVMRDQTQWKRLQERLQQANEALAQVDRQRNAFIAMLGHELRNPLAPLRNAVHLLPRVAGDTKRCGALVQMMDRQVTQMGRLIDDLLDISRVTQGKISLRLERIDLGSVIQDAVEVVGEQCRAGQHELIVMPSRQPIMVDGDAARLTQVVVNLLSNACKFTPPDGRVWLSAEREQGEAIVRVRDTGIGLEPHERDTIFEMFTQLDTSIERANGGLGIGLALVRQVVELHGGTVQVDSAGRGEGSEFLVRLPMVE